MFKMFRKKLAESFMGGEPPQKVFTHPELTPQLQQQLFELGRVTYLHLANVQTLSESIKTLAQQIDAAEKKASKKGRRRSRRNPAGLTPIPQPQAAPVPPAASVAGNEQPTAEEE